jgi:hypothetical protein
LTNAKKLREWRRYKVMEMYSMGYDQRTIAYILKVSLDTVHSDLSFLRRLAAIRTREYVEKELQHEFISSLHALDISKKTAFQIMRARKVTTNQRLHAISVAIDAVCKKMELVD